MSRTLVEALTAKLEERGWQKIGKGDVVIFLQEVSGSQKWFGLDTLEALASAAQAFFEKPSVSAHEGDALQQRGSLDDIVERFLTWQLPVDFAPDNGISFRPFGPNGDPTMWPTGTNLFSFPQARGMLEHVLAPYASAIERAYAFLWMFNIEPAIPMRLSPEKIAYESRRLLRDLMTYEQRRKAINALIQEIDCVSAASRPSNPQLDAQQGGQRELTDEEIISAQLTVPHKNPDGEDWGEDELDIALARAVLAAAREKQ